MLIPGLSNTDAEAVFVGGNRAAVVYLGTQQVWPTSTPGTGVMGENLVINTLNTAAGIDRTLTIPAGATKFDVVLIGGGGGGGDGGCGAWKTATYTVGTDYPAGHVLKMYVGAGGDGSQALANTGGKPGGGVVLLATDGTTVVLSSAGGSPGSMPDRTGGTAADITYNGRTYKGGAGGVSSNQNGVDGNAPGGGGQGGNDEINGNNGGKGGSGGCYLFFY